jgi:hypothetical protein
VQEPHMEHAAFEFEEHLNEYGRSKISSVWKSLAILLPPLAGKERTAGADDRG